MNIWALLSPATGEQTSVWPYVIAGIGVLALIAFVLLSVLQKKKTDTPTDPTPIGSDPTGPVVSAEPTETNETPGDPE